MAKNSKKLMIDKVVYEDFDLEKCYCHKCDKSFKNIAGFKGHIVHKHTNFNKNLGRWADKERTNRLADLFLNNLQVEPKKKMGRKELLELAGYTPSTIQKNSQRPFNTQTFKEALDIRGVTGESILKTAQEAQEASQCSWFKGQLFKDEEPDHNIRIKGASLLADILGVKSQTHKVESINVNMSGEEFRDMLGFD